MRSKPSTVLIILLATSAAHAQTAPPANDRYGHMHMKYEKTWLGVDVANVDVTFDDATRNRIRELAAGQQYSDQVADKIAHAALEAQGVTVQLTLLRNAPFNDFLEAAQKNLERARDAGYISQSQYTTAWANVQSRFASLRDRGFKKGDRLVYRARPDSLQTTVYSGGHVLLDVTNTGEDARRAMIASYFAPGTDFRKGLTKDVFD